MEKNCFMVKILWQVIVLQAKLVDDTYNQMTKICVHVI